MLKHKTSVRRALCFGKLLEAHLGISFRGGGGGGLCVVNAN